MNLSKRDLTCLGPDLHLVRSRILHHLGCPSSSLATAAAISAYMHNWGDESCKLNLELLSELIGGEGRKFAQRHLDAFMRWQKEANVQIVDVIRGKRNVRQVTQFSNNKLNAAALAISELVQADPRNVPTLVKIDEQLDEAINLLRRPLKSVKPKAEKKQRADPRPMQGGSVNSWDRNVPYRITSLLDRGLRLFPVSLPEKKPLVWKWQQVATTNEAVIKQWLKKFPKAEWAVRCGAQLNNGFHTVIDVDRHGGAINGFMTLKHREEDLGPLPETFTVKTAGDGEHRHFISSRLLPSSEDLLGPELDCKASGGFVVAPGSTGYEIINDGPLAVLPEEWELALEASTPKRIIPAGERHDYLRGVAYATAYQGKDEASIVETLKLRLRVNCERSTRVIHERELIALAASAVAKRSKAKRMLDQIVA